MSKKRPTAEQKKAFARLKAEWDRSFEKIFVSSAMRKLIRRDNKRLQRTHDKIMAKMPKEPYNLEELRKMPLTWDNPLRRRKK